ncbi:hypothetical protein LQV63_24090 [Paenibacillus profundus]|uniref:Fe/B12 periplasmic-binding domain-containing protein n=1 Tax=Paenibacillus profundus TaxID=1173085 RepID=A0ABS8YKK8_9BACL|nr:hypothetical protein [Paenibacillus profundus]MCE5172361.1 hypothetical protein [Paenibacillus profundus]
MVMIVLCSACTQAASDPAREIEDGGERNVETMKSGNGGDDHYPVSITVYTDEGKEMTQTIEKEPKKVVVIGSAMAELMIEFGLKDKAVGLGYLDQSFSIYADQISQMPILTELWPSKEAVLALKPDLIYSVSYAFKEDRLGDISFWNDRGIPVLSAANFNIGRSIDILNYSQESKTSCRYNGVS